jgi:aspartate carbamoyltransferase regulatory subunit
MMSIAAAADRHRDSHVPRLDETLTCPFRRCVTAKHRQAKRRANLVKRWRPESATDYLFQKLEAVVSVRGKAA